MLLFLFPSFFLAHASSEEEKSLQKNTFKPIASRLKDIASIQGVRENILIGYGMVVGLQGTGDSNNDITGQSFVRLFAKLGLDTQNIPSVKSKNVAAVIATAKLPPFARMGQKLDVAVSSIGDASSLEGGILLVTPLRAGDQNIYAVAQGSVSLGNVIQGSGKNFPTVGRVVEGAMIEKDVQTSFFQKKNFRFALHQPDFTTAARVATLINGELGGQFAQAQDSGTIDVVMPFDYEGNPVELLALLENVNVHVDRKAKVVFNERTGTLVMGEKIQVAPVAIAHGDLSIEIQGGKNSHQKEQIFEISSGSTVSDLVKVLNGIGVKPKDLVGIFQSLKGVGALNAELEIL